MNPPGEGGKNKAKTQKYYIISLRYTRYSCEHCLLYALGHSQVVCKVREFELYPIDDTEPPMLLVLHLKGE